MADACAQCKTTGGSLVSKGNTAAPLQSVPRAAFQCMQDTVGGNRLGGAGVLGYPHRDERCGSLTHYNTHPHGGRPAAAADGHGLAWGGCGLEAGHLLLFEEHAGGREGEGLWKKRRAGRAHESPFPRLPLTQTSITHPNAFSSFKRPLLAVMGWVDGAPGFKMKFVRSCVPRHERAQYLG
eukprot:1160849-Pelagomonas_calceolata.AAC.7